MQSRCILLNAIKLMINVNLLENNSHSWPFSPKVIICICCSDFLTNKNYILIF